MLEAKGVRLRLIEEREAFYEYLPPSSIVGLLTLQIALTF